MKRSFIILLNIGYWIMYILLLFLFLLTMSAGAAKTSVEKQAIILSFIKVMSVVTILPGLISFYSFYHYIFERFLSRKKIGKAILHGLAIVLGCGIIGFVGLNLVSGGIPGRTAPLKEILIMILFTGMLCLVHGVVALVLKGFISWYADIRIKEDLKQKNFETELALIKLQLEPHFLFNTINNIDVLIEKDPVKASLYLNKLSDIMRFMLYETKTDLVLLEKEMAYISKYIDLQKIRNANAGYVQYRSTGNPDNIMIAPMLFIPFIENAFKHSANKKKDNAISIGLSIEKPLVHFYCNNFMEENPLAAAEAGGLGNELIKKRLELLYPGRHELLIRKENSQYMVQLTIHTSIPAN